MTDLPLGWRRSSLSDFILLQRGFDLPKVKRNPGVYRVLSSGETSGWHDLGPVKGPGFVVGRATNIGRPTWSNEDYWPLNTVLYAKDFLGNDPKFAYYWFLATDLSAYNSGSVQPMLNRNYIANVPIDVPPLAEQRGIAATLGVLDEKIESARIAHGIIRSILSAAFQRTIGRHEAVDVPLGDLTLLTKGVSYKSLELLPSKISLVTLKSFDRNGGYKPEGLKPYVGPFKSQQVIVPGEIAVAQTDLTQGAEVVGRAIRVPADPFVETLVASLDLVIVRPTDRIVPEYLFGVVTDESFRQHCRSHTSGTTVLHLASDAIRSYQTPLISMEAQVEFASTVRPLIKRADALADEARALGELRDVLLPELISGRVRVLEAKRAVVEALT